MLTRLKRNAFLDKNGLFLLLRELFIYDPGSWRPCGELTHFERNANFDRDEADGYIGQPFEREPSNNHSMGERVRDFFVSAPDAVAVLTRLRRNGKKFIFRDMMAVAIWTTSARAGCWRASGSTVRSI